MINAIESKANKDMYNVGGDYILDQYATLTFEELEKALFNVYIYCNPWHDTDQAEHYTPYLSFNESLDLWAGDNFYKQGEASKHYLNIVKWLKA